MKYSIANKLDQIRRTAVRIVRPTKVSASCFPKDAESVSRQVERRIALHELRDLVLAMPLPARASVDTTVAGLLVDLRASSTNETEIEPLLIDIQSDELTEIAGLVLIDVSACALAGQVAA
jgi:hypothetical protein